MKMTTGLVNVRLFRLHKGRAKVPDLRRLSHAMRKPVNKSKPVPLKALVLSTCSRIPVWLLAGLLMLVTVNLFWPATRCDFINYDDNLYVTSNVHIQQGFTWESIKWAFVNPVASNWHPLTMLSHMLDCQLFGLKPWGHHLTSVLLHAVNTLLVFLLLRGLTGAVWRSLFVAALFGWHPLHVESVAWVAERKDVLSTFFGLLSLIFYARYAQVRSRVESRESSARDSGLVLVARPPASALDPRPSTLDYGLALFFFALGLMSKAMLVTLPFVLLLLDYWPLQRFTFGPRLSTLDPRLIKRLLVEKIPFLLLSAAICVITVLAQKTAIQAAQHLHFSSRAGNALVSYAVYLGQMLYPGGLTIFYPHPGNHVSLWAVCGSALMLLIISLGVMAGRRKYPWLPVGWFWYLGMLVPVIGLIQVGDQARADRYVYLPQIGISIMVAWGMVGVCESWRWRRVVLGTAAGTILAGMLGTAYVQTVHWRDSVALWTHALACTSGNYLAHNNLGVALAAQGKLDEAIQHYQQALLLKPDYAAAHVNLGVAQARRGNFSPGHRTLPAGAPNRRQ